MYVPMLARFTALDPLPPDGEPVLLGRVPDGLARSAPPHAYGYASNNAMRFTDPSGMAVVEAICQKFIMYPVYPGGSIVTKGHLVSSPPANAATACPPGWTFIKFNPFTPSTF